MNKISFCTVSMNRSKHIKQTLPINILDNLEYDNLQFVILDYNSTDDLEEYIKTTMMAYIESKKLVYYKTFTPKYFNRSHSRNLLFKLAETEIICNIDADNFTGKGFASYVNEQFSNTKNIFLSTISSSHYAPGDVLGRVCLMKTDFMKIRGYDERLISYAFEDVDIVNRLKNSKFIKRNIPIDSGFLKAISHGNDERLSNEFLHRNLRSIYIKYIDPLQSEFLYLFKDKTFVKFILIDNILYNTKNFFDLKSSLSKYGLSILKNSSIDGIWNKSKNTIILKDPTKKSTSLQLFEESNGNLKSQKKDDSIYYRIIDTGMIKNASMIFSQIPNRIIMEENLKVEKSIVNANGFGQDVVFKNFNYERPINIS